jgi:hypothetical protein
MAKTKPKPILDRRLLALCVCLGCFCLGLLVALLVPGSAVLLLVALLVVLVLLAGAMVWIWNEQYKAWASKPVRRLPKSRVGGLQ